MELCEESLRDVLKRRGRLSVGEATEVALSVLRALEEVHREGFVHRDIKPENVLRCGGRWKLTDFGIAKAMTAAASVTGFAGTPLYAAPEMVDRRFGRISEKTDVWQVGCLLYEMVAGKPPFRSDSPLELARMIAEEEPEEVDSPLWGLIRDMMRKRPEERISVDEAIRRLEAEGKYRRVLEAIKKGAVVNRELAELLGIDYDKLVELARMEGIAMGEGRVPNRVWRTPLRLVHEFKLILQLTYVGLAGPGAVGSVAFSPDGRYLATGSEDRLLRIFEVGSWRKVFKFRHSGRIFSLAFSPDGRYLATGSEDRLLRIFEVGSWRKVAEVEHINAVGTIAFSPDGELLAVGSGNIYLFPLALADFLRIYEVGSWRRLLEIKHGGRIFSLAFSPDGRFLATGSSDKQLRVFEVGSWKTVFKFEHDSLVFSVAFSPDGRFLATGSSGGHLRVFWIRPRFRAELQAKRQPELFRASS